MSFSRRRKILRLADWYCARLQCDQHPVVIIRHGHKCYAQEPMWNRKMCGLCVNEIKCVNESWHRYIPQHPASFIDKYPTGPLHCRTLAPRLSVMVGIGALRHRHRKPWDNSMSGREVVSYKRGEIGGWDPVANWDVRSGATVWLFRENPHMDGSL